MEELLNKYFTGEITADEKKKLFEVMKTDSHLRAQFQSLQNIMALSGCMRTDEDVKLGRKAYLCFEKRINQQKVRHFAIQFSKYAAAVILIFFSSMFFFNHQNEKMLNTQISEVLAPCGQRVEVVLPDGTKAWLSPCSKLSYAASFNKKTRDIELTGSSFFEVAHDKSKPFTIKTGDYQITVLGTRFNVRSYSEQRFEVNLVEGSVQVENLTNPVERITLKPNEQAIVCNHRLIKKKSVFFNEDSMKNGIYSFVNQPFIEILTNVALWNGMKLRVAEKVDSMKTITGKFRQSDSLESILHVLTSFNNFRYQITDKNELYIYR